MACIMKIDFGITGRFVEYCERYGYNKWWMFLALGLFVKSLMRLITLDWVTSANLLYFNRVN